MVAGDLELAIDNELIERLRICFDHEHIVREDGPAAGRYVSPVLVSNNTDDRHVAACCILEFEDRASGERRSRSHLELARVILDLECGLGSRGATPARYQPPAETQKDDPAERGSKRYREKIEHVKGRAFELLPHRRGQHVRRRADPRHRAAEQSGKQRQQCDEVVTQPVRQEQEDHAAQDGKRDDLVAAHGAVIGARSVSAACRVINPTRRPPASRTGICSIRCSAIRSATSSAVSSSVHVKSEEDITCDTGVAVGWRPAATNRIRMSRMVKTPATRSSAPMKMTRLSISAIARAAFCTVSSDGTSVTSRSISSETRIHQTSRLPRRVNTVARAVSRVLVSRSIRRFERIR